MSKETNAFARQTQSSQYSQYLQYSFDASPISGQCSNFMLPENPVKPLFFWCFQGV